MTGFDTSSRETREQRAASDRFPRFTLRVVLCKEMDTLSKEKRSRNMAAVHSKDTGPEVLVRRFLWSKGIRYRLHATDIPGRPDIVLYRCKLAVFVHGCFWHGHEGCSRGRPPKTNSEFWRAKIDGNKKRDSSVAEKLKQVGWSQLVIWDCQLKTQKAAAVALPKLLGDIHSMCPELALRSSLKDCT